MARRLLAEVPELPRLRLSSLDPSEIDDELWALFAEEPRLMPHLHLSLQAGDDLILKRMKRRHSRADAIAAARRARALRPEVAIGADLIAGFPTEDEAMFRNSLDLVEECGIAFLHVFPYSPRPGTPAARMPAVAPVAGPRARGAAARGRRGGLWPPTSPRASAPKARCWSRSRAGAAPRSTPRSIARPISPGVRRMRFTGVAAGRAGRSAGRG